MLAGYITNKILIIWTLILLGIVFILFMRNSINDNRKNQYRIENLKNNVYIDLGANKGDSVYNFFDLNSEAQGGDLKGIFKKISLKNQKWTVYAFEANGFFDESLLAMKTKIESLGHIVYLYNQTAAWKKNGSIDFYLDTINEDYDFWGSSLNVNHPDVIESNRTKVTVKCIDIAEIIKQFTLDDNIIVKMDIEGSEYDLLQDFIVKDVLKLIDYLAVEFHDQASPFKDARDLLISLINLHGVNFLNWS